MNEQRNSSEIGGAVLPLHTSTVNSKIRFLMKDHNDEIFKKPIIQKKSIMSMNHSEAPESLESIGLDKMSRTASNIRNSKDPKNGKLAKIRDFGDKENDEERKLLENMSRASSGGSSVKYKKEEHYIKRILLSRMSSPARSLDSRRSGSSMLSKGSRDIRTKLKKVTRIEGEGKSTGVKFSEPLSIMAPSASVLSLKTDLSNSSSITNLSKLTFTPGIFRNKKEVTGIGIVDLEAGDINGKEIKVKLEENEMPKLRKRVCRKAHDIFCKEFKLQKSMSKRLTLVIEGRVNRLYPHDASPKYIRVIKSIFKKLRVRNMKFYIFNNKLTIIHRN